MRDDSVCSSSRQGDAFLIHDYEGKIFDVNRRACETLGYERQELLGMRISDVDIEVQRRSTFFASRSASAPVNSSPSRASRRGKTAVPFPVEVRLGRLDLGEQKLFLSLTRDITERKRANDTLRAALREITELKNRLEKENVHLRREIELKYRHETIVGESSLIKKMLDEAERVAKGDTYVLIQGETGTGKELLARAIHNMSLRKGRSMVTVNCAALPPTLIESELFGTGEGGLTGAVSRQRGRFEAANGSTLSLDEIGDLPSATSQAPQGPGRRPVRAPGEPETLGRRPRHRSDEPGSGRSRQRETVQKGPLL